jgi:hypothetical protein
MPHTLPSIAQQLKDLPPPLGAFTRLNTRSDEVECRKMYRCSSLTLSVGHTQMRAEEIVDLSVVMCKALKEECWGYERIYTCMWDGTDTCMASMLAVDPKMSL